MRGQMIQHSYTVQFSFPKRLLLNMNSAEYALAQWFLPSRAELPTWHQLLSRARLGFSSPWRPGTAQRGACLWLNQQTYGMALWAESC